MIKKNDFTTQLKYTVILNIQSQECEYYNTLDKDIIEFGIKVAATVIDKGRKNCIPVKLLSNGKTIDGKKCIKTLEGYSKGHILGLLSVLARVELKKELDFDAYLKSIMSGLYETDIIIITAYLNESIIEILKDISNKNNRVTIILLDDSLTIYVYGSIDIFLLSQGRYKK